MAAGIPHDSITGADESAGPCVAPGLPPGGTERPPSGWTAGRIIAVIAGSVLILISFGLLGGGPPCCGSLGLSVLADAGISAPWLFRLAVELIITGVVLGALSAALIVVPVRLAGAGK
jgi:hypothetical protein